MSREPRDREREAWLLRHLTGEGTSDERAELARRLAEEPELAAEAAELDRIWRRLELPPPASAPPGFAGRIAARARAARIPAAGESGFAGLRWASALVLLLGIGGGTAISYGLASTADDAEATLAESYLDAARGLADSGGTDVNEPADDATESELEAGEDEL
jgi:anti-sigma factor RsiW